MDADQYADQVRAWVGLRPEDVTPEIRARIYHLHEAGLHWTQAANDISRWIDCLRCWGPPEPEC